MFCGSCSSGTLTIAPVRRLSLRRRTAPITPAVAGLRDVVDLLALAAVLLRVVPEGEVRGER